MIGKGAQYLTAAGFGRYRITAASLGRGWVMCPWLLSGTARQAIMAAFGVDGAAVIAATNEYLNGIAAQGQAGKAKATALAGLINEDPMMVCSIVDTPKFRYGLFDGTAYIKSGLTNTTGFLVDMDIIFDKVSGDDNRTIGTFTSSLRSWLVITRGYCNLGIRGDNFDNTYLLDTTTLYRVNLSTLSGNAYVKMNGTTIKTLTTTYTTSGEIYVMRVNGLGDNQKGKLGSCKFYDPTDGVTEIQWLVPFMDGQTPKILDLTASMAQGTKVFATLVGNITIAEMNKPAP